VKGYWRWNKERMGKVIEVQERLGYPTQKPEPPLERIVEASSNEGDDLAISLIKTRLFDAYGKKIERTYKMIGEPVDFAEAEQLAKDHPYQFQWWTLGLVGARAPLRNSSVKSTSIYTFRPSSGAKMGQEDRH